MLTKAQCYLINWKY